MAKTNKDAKPEITESVLEKLVTITMLNERYWTFEKHENPTFYDHAFELYFRYLKETKPVLMPYRAYVEVKNEMDKMEARFKRQVSKIYVHKSSNMQSICECIAEEYRKPNSAYGLSNIISKEYIVKREGSKYAIHQSFDEYKELLGGRYELVTVLDKPTAKKAAKGDVLLDCEWVKIK